MSVETQYALSLKINGTQISEFFTNIRYMGIYENASELLPSLELELVDPIMNRDLIPLYDGSLIEVMLEVQTGIQDSSDPLDPEGPAVWMPFRVFKIEAVPANDVDIIKVTAYYDAPAYFSEAGFGYFEGVSTAAARQIALASKLTFEGDGASDSQVWYQAGKPGGHFIQEVTKVAWKDDASFFQCVVTSEGKLRFYNLGDRARAESDWIFKYSNVMTFSDAPNVVTVSSLYSNPTSGLLNKWQGYGVVSGYEDLVGGGYKAVNVRDVRKTTDKLAVNSKFVKPVRYDPGPANLGNTHPNYQKARIQNNRYLALYSDSIRVMTTMPKKVHLLDKVTFNMGQEARGSLRADYSGDYFVSQCAKYIIDGSLTAMYTLTKAGINVISEDLLAKMELL